MTPDVARYPYETAITAYGNGGFRFAEMSHRGSILCLPSGVYAWSATSAEALDEKDIEFLLSRLDPPITVLLGTGDNSGLHLKSIPHSRKPASASNRCRQEPRRARTTS
jgi:uncharacterized protein